MCLCSLPNPHRAFTTHLTGRLDPQEQKAAEELEHLLRMTENVPEDQRTEEDEFNLRRCRFELMLMHVRARPHIGLSRGHVARPRRRRFDMTPVQTLPPANINTCDMTPAHKQDDDPHINTRP